jgi:predicted Zn finger-like uncharacterized protein
MRLVCPNCEAKYEVPEDAIPETGRDVQCANCGHSWYQMRQRTAVAETAAPAAVTAPAAASAEPAPPAPTPAPAGPQASAESIPGPVVEVPVTPEMPVAEAEPEVSPPAAAEAEPVVEDVAETAAPESVAAESPDASDVIAETPVEDLAPVNPAVDAPELAETVVKAVVSDAAARAADPVPEATVAAAVTDTADSMEPARAPSGATDDADPEDDEDVDAAPGAAAAAPAAYAVDESVLAILREEAEREATARRNEAGKPLEVQADLGIDSAMPAAVKSGAEAVADQTATAVDEDRLAARRTQLPDVEEINSTLQPTEEPGSDSVGDAMPAVAEGRSSFRSGFLLVMTIAILGTALYSSAGSLGRAVPALAGFLDGYVGFVDSLRLQLDGLMQSATVAINGN